MTARTHDLFAFASLVTIAAYYPPPVLTISTFFASLIGCVIGSLFPDMDQAGNRLWDLFPGGDYVGRVLRPFFLGHRSLSHSLLGIFLMYKLLDWLLPKFLNPGYFNYQTVLTAVMIGFISHLISDGLTEEGLPLFFPFRWRVGFPPFRSWRITTGAWFEKFVVFPAILIYLFFFITGHQTALLGLFKLMTG